MEGNIDIILIGIFVILLVIVLTVIITQFTMKKDFDYVFTLLRTIEHIVQNKYIPSEDEVAAKKAEEQRTKDLDKESQDIGKGFR